MILYISFSLTKPYNIIIILVMYKVEWKTKALRQARKIHDKKTRVAISQAVGTLRNWPDCQNIKSLKNRDDYRLRVGRYRVIFTVTDAIRIITIEEVKKRDEQTY